MDAVKYGLCGKTLTHSYSKKIHERLGNPEYRLCSFEEAEFEAFLRERTFRAVNVTLPYKKKACTSCDFLDAAAEKTDAVNTIVNRSGLLYGYNTDYFGFLNLVQASGISLVRKKVLILGSGGTSRTVGAAAEAMGAAECVMVSRNGPVDYKTVSEHRDADLIINTTPVGMFPNNGSCLVDLKQFLHLCGVIDVVYNPLRTRLLYEAERLGIPCAGGLRMLAAQAVRAHELFFDCAVPEREVRIEDIFAQCRNEAENLLLIGMPGCGKTSVGRELARLTGRPFYDSDRCVQEATGKEPALWIRQDGEAAFRRVETEVLRELTKRSGCVIAVGGGAVLAEENRYLLRQNSWVIWLKRSLQSLSTEERPLSEGNGTLETMWKEREPLYREAADFCMTVEETPDAVAKRCLQLRKDGRRPF